MSWSTQKSYLSRMVGCVALLITLNSYLLNAQVTTYPAPSGATLSSDYTVKIGNTNAAVYVQGSTHGTPYSYVYFDFSGSVTLKITCSTRSLANAVIRPATPATTRSMKGDTLVVTLDAPRKISIEPDAADGRQYPLLVFGNPLLDNPPKQGDPGVTYYGPGLYTTDVTVGANQTLYIAGGAVITGRVTMNGNNSKVIGRGIVSGGATGSGGNLRANNVRNGLVDGVIFAGSGGWTVVPTGCDSFRINNIKILNSFKQNEDGIDIVNCRDVWVSDAFVRTDDDCIAIKGMDRSKSCERITIERCLFWADRACVFRIGYESEASGILANKFIARDCDVIHAFEEQSSAGYWSYCPFALEPADETPMANLLFEDIRLNVDQQSQFTLARVTPIVRDGWGWPNKIYGKYIKNVRFKNITVTGVQKPITITVAGVDAQHYVDSITFENVMQYGQCTQRTTSGVAVGNFATNVVFTCGTVTAPKMSVRGNNAAIANNDNSPSRSDFTNFDTVDVTNATRDRVFKVYNTGNAVLALTGVPKVALSGANAADFSVTVQPASPVNSADSSTFTIRLDPSAAGVRTATVSIINNDNTVNPFTFAVSGVGKIATSTLRSVIATNNRNVVVSVFKANGAHCGTYSFDNKEYRQMMSSLSEGVYLVNVFDGKRESVEKISVINNRN